MLKILVFLTLFLHVFDVQAYAHANQAKDKAQSGKPSPPVPAVMPQHASGQSVQPEHEKHIDANVRVVSTPTKDRYDWIAFCANIALVIVGFGGIVVAGLTLRKIERQTKAAEDAAVTVVKQTNHMVSSERAWLVIGGVKESFEHPIILGSGVLTWEIKNVGHTPAILVETQSCFDVDYAPVWPLPEEPKYGEPVVLGGRILAPGDTLQFHGFPRKDGRLAFHDGPPEQGEMVHVMAYGYVKYRTLERDCESRFLEYSFTLPTAKSSFKFNPYFGKDTPQTYTKHT